MKKLLLFIFISISNILIAQNQPVIFSKNISLSENDFKGGNIIKNPPNEIEGTPFLFENWNNRNNIYLSSKKSIRLENINVHVDLNKFIFKLEDGKYFSFDQNYFKYVIINNRKFEFFNFYGTNTKRIFEVIGKFKNKYLLKGYLSYVIKGNKGYQQSTSIDKLRIKFEYFVKDRNNYTKIKLKKKEITPLFKDKEDKIVAFVKKEKLSFKKEKDIKKIIAYYNTLK